MNPSLLLISGWAHGLDAIQPMGDALANRFDVELLTGAAVLRERTLPDADYIVAGSMGGLLAIELLPVSCRKLVLISSTAKFCSDHDFPYGIHEKILRRMMMELKRDPETVLDEFSRNVHHPFRESRQAIALRKSGAPDLNALADGLQYLLHSDIREKIPGMDLPVLLLHGAEDRIIPVEASKWMHSHLQDSQLNVIENDGHALPAHHFETVIKTIYSFLQADGPT